jgi:hypothetical protein
MRKLLVIAIALVLPLLAGDRDNETLSTTRVERFSVLAAGEIRLENSFGEVAIDGWDRPEVELTVVRSSEHLSTANGRAEAQRRLDSVQVAATQNRNDVLISTMYPPRNGFLHPLSRRSDIRIGYRIKAPRATKLIVDHHSGGVSVFDIDGDIHATVINGQMTLALRAEGRYAIDAQSKIGSVHSDFEGRDQSRRVLGEAFVREGAESAPNLYLRTRIGDIVILKLRGLPVD